MKNVIFALLMAIFLITGCESNVSHKKQYSVSQLDALIRDLNKEKSFSVILHDMDMDDNGNRRHKYKVILTRNKLPKDSITDWKPVTPLFFEQHEQNMGMEIASKDTTGKVSKKASPPGYNNYVGNSQYGQWKTDPHGNSFWEFYGQYMFMQQVLGLNQPVYRTEYHTYSTEYKNSDRSYYGSDNNGRSQYGSYSSSSPKSKYQEKVESLKKSDRSGKRTYSSPSSTYSSSNSSNYSSSTTSKPKTYTYGSLSETRGYTYSSSSSRKPSSNSSSNSSNYSYDKKKSYSSSNSLRDNSTTRKSKSSSSSSSSIFRSGSSYKKKKR